MPPASDTHVVAAPRPNTVSLQGAQLVEYTADQLRAMDDSQLLQVCDYFGLPAEQGWARTKILTTLFRASVAAVNY